MRQCFFIPYGYTFYLLHNFVAWYKMTKLYIFFFIISKTNGALCTIIFIIHEKKLQ